MKKNLFVVAAGLFISSQLSAQDSTTKSLSEVIITANKVNQKILETGKVTTVINRKTIEQSAGKDLAQLLTEQAGIVINGATSNPGKDKSFYLRGAGNGYTVILIDGIPVNDPSFAGAFDLRLLPLDQVERIEIVKGAQSTNYGSDAVAGVINIISKKGANKPAQFYGNAAAGSFNTYKFTTGVRGTAEKINYNFSYTHNESQGISEALDTTKSKSFDKDGFLNNAVSISVDAPVGKLVRVQPFARYSYFQGGYDDGSYSDAANTFNSSLLTAGSSVELKTEKGGARTFFSYDEMDRSFVSEAYGPTPFKGSNKIFDIYGYYQVAKNVKVLAGIDNRYQKNLDSNVHINSPYVSLFLQNFKGFYLEAGARYNKHSKYGDNFTYSINPSYVLNENVKLFVNYATAFRAPSISALYGAYGANPNLKPELSRTFEAGVQTSLFDDKLNFRAVYFDRHGKDVIIYTNKYENYDKQDDHGFEIEPTIQFNKQIKLSAYYSYVNGEVTTRGAGNKDTSYFNLLRRPKHSFGATLSYQITASFFVSTNAYNYGKRTDTDFGIWPAPAKEVILKSYFLWSIHAEYSVIKDKLVVFADGKNLLDKDYVEVLGYSTPGINFIGGIRFNL
jgi:vitamin B12 transporter